MKKLLEDNGYTVLEARNGEEAIELFQAHQSRIALSVLDVVMPRMSGRAVFDEIVARNPEAKVFFLSGYVGDMLNLAKSSRSGVRVLEKPCLPMAFLSAVREILDS